MQKYKTKWKSTFFIENPVVFERVLLDSSSLSLHGLLVWWVLCKLSLCRTECSLSRPPLSVYEREQEQVMRAERKEWTYGGSSAGLADGRVFLSLYFIQPHAIMGISQQYSYYVYWSYMKKQQILFYFTLFVHLSIFQTTCPYVIPVAQTLRSSWVSMNWWTVLLECNAEASDTRAVNTDRANKGNTGTKPWDSQQRDCKPRLQTKSQFNRFISLVLFQTCVTFFIYIYSICFYFSIFHFHKFNLKIYFMFLYIY